MRNIRRLVLLLTAVAGLMSVSCTVDYAGILGGKECDPSGNCAPRYLCDRHSWSCVPAGNLAPDAALADTGHHKDGGVVVVYTDAGRADAGHGDAGGHDTGLHDTGVDDVGGPDTGTLDAGEGDTGADDAGLLCTPGERHCADDHYLDKCRSDGQEWLHDEYCAEFCLNDKCVDCVPETKWCANGNFLACDASGNKSETPCQFGCYDADPQCLICKPGGVWCDGGTAKTCHADGLGADPTDSSPYVTNVAPLNCPKDSTVTITWDGCNFRSDSKVVWCESSCDKDWAWNEDGAGSYTSRTTTQIIYQFKQPHSHDRNVRVHNPDDGNSQSFVFKAN